MLRYISILFVISVLVGLQAGFALGKATGDRYVHTQVPGSRLNCSIDVVGGYAAFSPVVLPNRYPVLTHGQTSIYNHPHIATYSEGWCECFTLGVGGYSLCWDSIFVRGLAGRGFVWLSMGRELDCSPQLSNSHHTPPSKQNHRTHVVPHRTNQSSRRRRAVGLHLTAQPTHNPMAADGRVSSG